LRFFQNQLSRESIRHFLLDLARGRFSQDVFWNWLSLGVLAAGGIVVNLIIVSWRGTAALGIFNQVFAIYIILSQIGVGGVQFSVLNYVSRHQENLTKCAEITTVALILAAVIAAIVGVACYVLAEPIGRLLNSPAVGLGLQMVAPGLFFFALNKTLVNVVNGVRRMKAYAVLRATRYLLLPCAILIILLLGMADPYLALALTVTEAALFVVLVVYFEICLFPLRSFLNLRYWIVKHFSFGARGFLAGLLTEANTRVDVLMLGYFSSDATVGIYSFAAVLAEGFAQIPIAVRWNVDPILGCFFAEQKKEQISLMARKIKLVFYPVMFIAGFIAALAYPFVFSCWLGKNELFAGWAVFAIIMSGIVLSAGYQSFMGILLQGERPGANTLFMAGLVLGNFLLNVLLIPIWGIYGAAMANGLTYIFGAISLAVITRRLMGVRI